MSNIQDAKEQGRQVLAEAKVTRTEMNDAWEREHPGPFEQVVLIQVFTLRREHQAFTKVFEKLCSMLQECPFVILPNLIRDLEKITTYIATKRQDAEDRITNHLSQSITSSTCIDWVSRLFKPTSSPSALEANFEDDLKPLTYAKAFLDLVMATVDSVRLKSDESLTTIGQILEHEEEAWRQFQQYVTYISDEDRHRFDLLVPEHNNDRMLYSDARKHHFGELAPCAVRWLRLQAAKATTSDSSDEDQTFVDAVASSSAQENELPGEPTPGPQRPQRPPRRPKVPKKPSVADSDTPSAPGTILSIATSLMRWIARSSGRSIPPSLVKHHRSSLSPVREAKSHQDVSDTALLGTQFDH